LMLVVITYVHRLSRKRFGPIFFRLLLLLQLGIIYETVSKNSDAVFLSSPYEGETYNLTVAYRIHDPERSPITRVDYQMYLNCRGNGKIPVLLDAGMPFSSSSMNGPARLLAKELSNVTVCTYDRLGYGWSVPSHNDRSVVNMASEIRTLMYKKFNLRNSPMIYVGWSFGGLIGQTYTEIWGHEVGALVLVDSMNFHILKDNPKFVDEIQLGKQMFTVVKALTPIGLARVIGILGLFPPESGYPPHDALLSPKSRTTMRSFYFHQRHYLDVAYEELNDLEYTIQNVYQQWAKRKNWLKKQPIIALMAGNDTRTEKQRNRDLDRLMSLSSNVFPMVTNKSDHFIPFHDPGSIISAVKMAMELRKH